MEGTNSVAVAEECGGAENARRYRKSLRNANINYRSGWFFVTVQARHNKSIFGAIVGETVALNSFGRAVWEYWRGMSAKYPELEVFESVLMPNHFHALVRVHYREDNKPHHLGFLMSRFKGGTSFLYGKARRAGEVEDVGDHLWQIDYWDNLVTSEAEFKAIAKYIRENPRNWSRDRYGACTSHAFGDLELLNAPRVAFVASQGFYASELRPRMVWAAQGRLKPPTTIETGGERIKPPTTIETSGERIKPPTTIETGGGAGSGETGGGESGIVDKSPVLISTFTSAQEREALRRALAKGKRVIQVVPQGLPTESEMQSDLLAACREGRALLLSPQPTGSRLNKKVATWCNEYVLRHASEIWVGDLSPNGMLATMLNGLHRDLAKSTLCRS